MNRPSTIAAKSQTIAREPRIKLGATALTGADGTTRKRRDDETTGNIFVFSRDIGRRDCTLTHDRFMAGKTGWPTMS